MFCNRCGGEIQPQFKLCPNCGQPTGVAASTGRIERHIRTLGILWVVAGALFLFPAFLLMCISGVVHIAVPDTAQLARAVAPLVLTAIGTTLLLIGGGGILVGWGLLNREPWARVAAVVLGILALFHPPFGTALGIYSLWVLLSNDGGAEYARLARA